MGWKIPAATGFAEAILAPLQRGLTAIERVGMLWDAWRGYPCLKRRFARKLGYDGDFDAPKTLNEKINWRKLHDRAAVYPVIADKVRLRDYLAQSLGADRADAILPNRRLVTARPTVANLSAVGTGVAIKANHGSGWVRIIAHGTQPDWPQIAADARMWLRRTYGLRKHEWAYWAIPPQILVEDLVLGADGEPAQDLKFTMIGGHCVYVFVMQNFFGDQKTAYFNADWQEIPPAGGNGGLCAADQFPAPAYFPQLLALAQEIARDFDYIRVDFLCGVQQWCLNELTLYRSSGFEAFDPPELDLAYGTLWAHRPYQGLWRG